MQLLNAARTAQFSGPKLKAEDEEEYKYTTHLHYTNYDSAIGCTTASTEMEIVCNCNHWSFIRTPKTLPPPTATEPSTPLFLLNSPTAALLAATHSPLPH